MYNYDQFHTWFVSKLNLEKHSIKVDSLNENEMQVRAIQEIKQNEPVLQVPQALLITSNDQLPIWKPLSETRITGIDRLACFLAWHKTQGKKSSMYSYINILPQNIEHLPFYWKNSALEIIKETDLYNQILSYRKRILGKVDQVLSCINFSISKDDYIWARLIVASRNFGITIHGKSVNCLIPYADMLNHDVNPSTQWSFNDKTNCFEMLSKRPIHSGDIVTDTYGTSKSADQLLLYYGFYPSYNRSPIRKIYNTTLEQDYQRLREARSRQDKLALKYLISHKVEENKTPKYFLKPK